MNAGDQFDDLTITADELRELQRAWDLKLLRVQHPYVFDLIKVLARFPKLPSVTRA